MDFYIIFSLVVMVLSLALVAYVTVTTAADWQRFNKQWAAYREVRRAERVGRRYAHWQRVGRRARARELRRTIRGRRVVPARVSIVA